MSQKKPNTKKFWLYAFRDHLASLQAYSNCIHTADIFGDGDYKLLIADGNKKLKTYAGTALSHEVRLFGVPSAVTSFNMDTKEAFHRPTVAVALGPYIFMYRNVKPLYRFATPPVPLDPEEVAAWQSLTRNEITIEDAKTIFERKLDQGVDVSTRTLELLLMDNVAEQEAFVLRFIDTPLVQKDLVVCMASIYLTNAEEGQPSCLVYGTEKRVLYVLENNVSSTRMRLELPSTPMWIVTAGTLEGSHRIVVSCRDGCIYSVKNGALHNVVIQPDAQPCGIARYDNLIAVITMSNTLSYYNLKGKRQNVVFLPVPATNIATITDTVTDSARGVVVALSNGEIRVYVGSHLQHVSQAYGTITAMNYCRYGREDSALILVLQNGSLVVELLHRNADLSVTNSSSGVGNGGPPPEQETPIPIPKLSSVFTAQTEREREYGIDMYRSYQYDLCHLKLLTSKSYLSVMTGGEGLQQITSTPSTREIHSGTPEDNNGTGEAQDTAASAGAAAATTTTTMQQRATTLLGEASNVRFVATVQGLGPLYKVKGTIQNVGDTLLHDLLVVFLFDAQVYTMPKSLFSIPFLVPGLAYPCDALIELKEGETKGEGVLALVLGHEDGGKPLASTLVDLPEADLVEGS